LLRKGLPGIQALRDVTVAEFEKYESHLPEPVRRRCRHVVTENERTLKAADALENGDCETLGNLMRCSHESLRNDYEVSCRELDLMVEIASGFEGVFGARMTGGGFGGSTINLLRADVVEEFSSVVRAGYRAATNIDPDISAVEAADGAREEGVSGTGAPTDG
jgi:galactokinase